MADILVLGSEGVVGKPLCEELSRRGHTLVRADARHTDRAEYVRCDVSEYRQVERLFDRKFDCVYNLAAEFGRRNGEDYYEQVWKTNVIGLKHILTLQKERKFKLIQFSSSEIYGEPDVPEGTLLEEELSSKTPLFQNNDYAISKWVNELQVRNATVVDGIEAVLVRLFNAYGPGEHYTPYRSAVCQFIYKALKREPYNVYLGYKRVFMYVDDLIPTLATIADRFRAKRVYNIGGTEYVEVKAVSDMILGELGLKDDLVSYVPQELHNTRNKRPSIELAKRELGHDPKIPLKVGIPKTIDWMKKVYSR
ncbi:MAG: NAD(P)-dependent oxidoreductase [Nitrososphaerota archaeon]|nr:NAD(P)-dependent oxidoreductase [Nitrososphaerota archaeon]